ncbi:PLP-dependent cysteine synthase family protein [Shouchella clausii]|uniref:PLP-dependent cysteine synthase family protein n=1 Tax=Shouchella clausii TaxID=79880 RepID=UPI0026FD287F|nr:cysteine synthase family protein [Shouchella clausii]MDO7268249.1 cysteine synthase family protein [Shouchella clausii]MDO7288129.1 cysteine synthase family protein [Shouchella clausii]
MEVYRHIHELIGSTPMLELTAFPLPRRVRLFAKLEYTNPGGSIKDRLGIKLLKEAIATGKITPKGTLIEPTAGNTGIALALAAIGTDVKVICVVPKAFSIEKQQLMRALGAVVVHTPSEHGMKGAIAKAKALEQELDDAYCPQQFSNKANPLAYYETLGPEIVHELDGKVDVFVAGAGTGGTFSGTAAYLKEVIPGIRTVVVEPEGSILNGGEPGPHRTEGIGMEFIPDFVNRSLFEAIYTISDNQAFKRTRELAEHQGVLVGSSSGAALEAALREAEMADEGAHIVTVFPDGAERYLSKGIYEEEPL